METIHQIPDSESHMYKAETLWNALNGGEVRIGKLIVTPEYWEWTELLEIFDENSNERGDSFLDELGIGGIDTFFFFMVSTEKDGGRNSIFYTDKHRSNVVGFLERMYGIRTPYTRVMPKALYDKIWETIGEQNK